MERRDFLKFGALFVPALAVPRVAYSFFLAKRPLPELTEITINGVRFPGRCGLFLNGEKIAQSQHSGWRPGSDPPRFREPRTYERDGKVFRANVAQSVVVMTGVLDEKSAIWIQDAMAFFEPYGPKIADVVAWRDDG